MPLVRSTEFRSTCGHVALRQAGIGQIPTFEYLENVAPRCPEDARSRWMFDGDKVSEFVVVRDGTMNDIGQWLEQHGLGQYAEAFANNDIDFRALPTLTEEDLKELGLSLGHRRILQQAIAEFAERESTETETTDQAGEPVVPTGEAERRQLTIMFCDLVGSTALSESMDLEEYREVLAAYQAAVRKATEHYGGYIARYMGDGLLAYFGYPQAHEGDPERAVRAALTSVDAVSALDLVSPLEVRIGIATGPVVVGDIIGEGASEEAAVLGETPNVAARLQGVAGPNEVIISPSTERLLKNRVEVRRLAHMNLKGLSRPITPYQALRVRSMGEVSDASQKLLPLIGREVEVALLRRGWRTAQEGEGQVVILSGAAGVGKTRVVRSFQDEARGEIRNRVLWFCEPYYQTTANYPAIERIRRVLKLAEDDSTEKSLDKLESMLESLGLAVPELAPVLGFLLSISTETRYPPLAYSPEELRQRIISAQVDLLLAMAAQSPVLMVVEDVHWADPTTVEVLERFVEAIRAERILMILTSRPEFESPWLHHDDVTSHTLSRLNRHETIEMVKSVMRNKSLPRETMEQIVSRTDGVPLFVEEVTKALLSSAGEVGVPASLHDSLMARLDRLGPVKELAQTASVIGRSFPVELLATVSGRSMDEIETGLRTLREAGLAYPRRGHGHTIFDFKHALVRDAAYGSLLHSSRQTLHRRVAEQLAAGPQGQTEPELLATHYAEAGCLEDAAELWAIAGNRSAARSAFNEAVSHFSAGIDALSQLESTQGRLSLELDIRLSMGQTVQILEGFASEPAGEIFQHALEICDRLGERKRRAIALRGLSVFYVMHDLRAHTDIVQELKVIADESGDTVTRHYAQTALVSSNYLRGDFLNALEQARKGLTIFESAEKLNIYRSIVDDPRIEFRRLAAPCLDALGFRDQARESIDHAIEYGQTLNAPYVLSGAYIFGAMLMIWQRDYRTALQYAESALQFAEKYEFKQWLSAGQIFRGRALAAISEPEAGIDDMQRGISAWVSRSWRGEWYAHLAEACLQAGRYDLADDAVSRAEAITEATGDVHFAAEQLRLKGAVAKRIGKSYHEIESTLNQALEVARGQAARTFELRASMDLAHIWQEQSNLGKARNLLTPVYESFTEGFDTPDLKEAKGLLDELS